MSDNLKGVIVPDTVKPTSELDTYPTHDEKYGKGGYRSVKSIAERDAIPASRLNVGSKCLVLSEENGYYVDSIDEGGTVHWKLETSLFADKLLVSPTISGTFSFFKNDGVESATPQEVGVSNVNSKSITVENGYKVKYVGRFSWRSATGRKNPELCNGDFGTTLPESGVNSEDVTISNIASTRTLVERIVAKKKGFMVSGSSVVEATGNDQTQDQVQINIWHRRYFGLTTESAPNQEAIKALTGTDLSNTKNSTKGGVSAGDNQYYCYAYPKSLGALSSIIQNGAAPVLGDFNKTEIKITNRAGLQIDYYVYTSKNRGAFRGVSLEFK